MGLLGSKEEVKRSFENSGDAEEQFVNVEGKELHTRASAPFEDLELRVFWGRIESWSFTIRDRCREADGLVADKREALNNMGYPTHVGVLVNLPINTSRLFSVILVMLTAI